MEKENELEKSDNVFKLKKIITYSEVINRILTHKIEPVVRTKLIRIHKELRKEIDIYDEVRLSKAKELSGGKEKLEKMVDDKGVERQVYGYDIPPDKIDEFNKLLNELKEEKVEVTFTKIPISDFDKCEENIGILLANITDLLII